MARRSDERHDRDDFRNREEQKLGAGLAGVASLLRRDSAHRGAGHFGNAWLCGSGHLKRAVALDTRLRDTGEEQLGTGGILAVRTGRMGVPLVARRILAAIATVVVRSPRSAS